MQKKPKIRPLKQRVRIYLAEQGLTQERFALSLGVTPSHLSRVLSGKMAPSLSVALALERATGIPAREFAIETAVSA